MSSRAFCLPNLTTPDVTAETTPWITGYPVPTSLPSKDAYREWGKDPHTQSAFFSMVEGVVPALRVGSGNDPHRVHGIVADWDTPGMSPEEVSKALSRLSFQPTAWNKTFSGGLRGVWILEEPVLWVSKQVYAKFVAKASKELGLKRAAPGLDEGALENAGLYYCAGSNWVVNPEATLRNSLVHLWLFEAAKNARHTAPGIEIPLPAVFEEVQKQFPGRWTSPDFAEGSRGCRFWDPSGDANSVIIRSNGVTCFTGNQPFLSWREILGNEFVKEYQEKRTGGAIEELWYDGAHYFRQLPGAIRWDAMSTDVAKRHLQVEYGLNSKKEKEDDSSEVDAVLHHVETKKRVEGAAPFALDPNPIVRWNGHTYLNTATARMLVPAESCTGPEEFPELWDYLTGMFLDEQNLRVFLGWFHVWVRSVQEQSKQRGHVLFLAGGPSTGKSLLSQLVLPGLMGGYADARDFLVDGGRFNSSLFDYGLWCIDDSTAMSNHQRHARFSSLIKAVAANSAIQYERKYGYSGALPWCGRALVTLNDDAVSVSILPDTDSSLLDKVLLLQTGQDKARMGYTHLQNLEMVAREGPKFLRWVIDSGLPEGLVPDARFGFEAWHSKAILEEARSQTASHSVVQIVDMWRSNKDGVKELERTPTELYTEIASSYPEPMRNISLIAFGKHLSQAMISGINWIRRTRKGKARTPLIIIDIPSK